MAQTRAALVTLYSDQTGLTLECQPLTATGASTGAVVPGTTTERGGGQYRWVGSVPDDAEAGDFRNASGHAFLTQEPFLPVVPSGGSGGFTDEDSDILRDIDSRLAGNTTEVMVNVIDKPEGQEFELHQGFDYLNGDNQAVRLNRSGLPDLTGGHVYLVQVDGTQIVEGAIERASDTEPQLLRFDFPRAVTAALAQGRYDVRIRAVPADGHIVYGGGLTMHVRP